jgi:hypothetical protein
LTSYAAVWLLACVAAATAVGAEPVCWTDAAATVDSRIELMKPTLLILDIITPESLSAAEQLAIISRTPNAAASSSEGNYSCFSGRYQQW